MAPKSQNLTNTLQQSTCRTEGGRGPHKDWEGKRTRETSFTSWRVNITLLLLFLPNAKSLRASLWFFPEILQSLLQREKKNVTRKGLFIPPGHDSQGYRCYLLEISGIWTGCLKAKWWVFGPTDAQASNKALLSCKGCHIKLVGWGSSSG